MKSGSTSPQGVPFPAEDSAEYTPEFRKLLQSLQKKIETYNAARESSSATQDGQADLADAVEELREALFEAGEAHPDRKIGDQWKDRARKLRVDADEDQDNALKAIGIGLLKIIGSPIALVGLVLYSAGEIVSGAGVAAGNILTGVGSVLKGIGKAGRNVFKK